jgi:hypothetical protein
VGPLKVDGARRGRLGATVRYVGAAVSGSRIVAFLVVGVGVLLWAGSGVLLVVVGFLVARDAVGVTGAIVIVVVAVLAWIAYLAVRLTH